MDRSSTDHDPRTPFLAAEWRYLAMLNYELDPRVLHPFVPAGTKLDLWQGRCLVSVVGFLFLNTRVLGLLIPFHRDFEEVNLRFYVRRDDPSGTRRGVVFIKELVPKRAIAWVARTIYGENYHRVPMSHEVDVSPSVGGRAEYSWLSGGRRDSVQVSVSGAPASALPNSEEEFITEHYWGYARQRDDSTVEYEVRHPRWNVWQAKTASLDCDVERLYGSQFAESLSAEPTSAFLADGSPVTVHRGRKLE